MASDDENPMHPDAIFSDEDLYLRIEYMEDTIDKLIDRILYLENAVYGVNKDERH